MLENYRPITLLLSLGAFCVLGCGDHSAQQDPCGVAIPEGRLPHGWRLVPESKMPLSCKTPWRVKNPLLLEGPAAREIDVGGQPTVASRVWAVIYENGDDYIDIFCLKYLSPEQASAEYRTFTSEGESSEELLVGMLKASDDTIVVMIIEVHNECPSREFFVKHFDSIAVPK